MIASKACTWSGGFCMRLPAWTQRAAARGLEPLRRNSRLSRLADTYFAMNIHFFRSWLGNCLAIARWLMRAGTFLVLAAIAAIGFTTSTPKAQAQVGVEVGVAPECPYGYYDVAPYN